MASNYFVTYDLNGNKPTHAEMDAHLKKLGPCVHRVVETVWYVRSNLTMQQLHDYVSKILSANDRVLVILAADARMRNLLVPATAIQNCWNAA